MQRVAGNRNPAVDKFGVGKNGFTAGDPQAGVAATTPGAEFFDAVQEEISRVIEGSGAALDPAKYDQLLTAIKQLSWGNITRRVATQAEAEAGVDDTYQMTAHRVAQAIAALSPKQKQIQSIAAAAPAAGALPITYNGGTLDFRNGTLTDGAPSAGIAVPSSAITLPSGATLGLAANQQGRIVFLVAYNGGAPVLCVVNLAGSLRLDETNLISPTTISSGATASNVIYSASAVSANSPYRVVGFMDVTQAVSGTWVAPALVQGCGGQALAALSSLGYGQTWQSVTRAAGTTYYNTTGKPITLLVSASGTSASVFVDISINGGSAIRFCANQSLNGGTSAAGDIIIPAGASYVLTDTNVVTRNSFELR